MSEQIETARQQLFHLIEQMTTGENAAGGVQELQAFLTRYGELVFLEFLEDFAKTSRGAVQIASLGILLKCDPRPSRRRQVIGALERLLRTGTRDEQLFVAYQIYFQQLGSELLVSPLEALFQAVAADDPRRLWVAAALFQSADPDGKHEALREQAMWELFEGLKSPNISMILIAARALQHEQVHLPETCQTLIRAAEGASEDDRMLILAQLGSIGGADEFVVDFLMSVAGNVREPVTVRGGAIQSLAHCSARPQAINRLLYSLMQEDGGLILQAGSVLQHRLGELPEKTTESIIPWLQQADPIRRALAAQMLMEIPKGCSIAGPDLLKALEQEEDEEVAEAIILAVGHGGEGMVQKVVQAMEAASLSRLHRYQYALLELAPQHVQETSHLLMSHHSRIRRSAALAMHHLGSRIAGALPLINELLGSSDHAIVEDALVALQNVRVHGVPCAEALGRLLASPNYAIRTQAEAILVSIGVGAIPALEDLRHSSGPAEIEAIDRCLSQLHRLNQIQGVAPAGVDGILKAQDLELFCLMAELLQDSGPMSFERLGSQLAARQMAGTISNDLRCSPSKIRLLIAQLEQSWSDFSGTAIQLISRGNRKKGELTASGQHYLKKSREYLERLHRERPGGH